jgi:chromate transporter
MVLFAYGIGLLGADSGAGWIHGLKVAAVAVVAQAVFGMMRTLAPDWQRGALALAAAALVLAVPTAASQIGVIVVGALAGVLFLRATLPAGHVALSLRVGRSAGVLFLAVFAILLVGLPLLALSVPSHSLDLFAAFYRAGSLVFGGGHVVLPLLQATVVPPGWVGNDAFLAGYGAAQSIPGPLFTFAAYLGAVMGPEPNGWMGAVLCLTAIFLPSFLLVMGALPFWESLRKRPAAQAALRGANAAVVGLLLAALYDPVWKSGIAGAGDLALAAVAFLLLLIWRIPPWLVVMLCAVAGAAGA